MNTPLWIGSERERECMCAYMWRWNVQSRDSGQEDDGESRDLLLGCRPTSSRILTSFPFSPFSHHSRCTQYIQNTLSLSPTFTYKTLPSIIQQRVWDCVRYIYIFLLKNQVAPFISQRERERVRERNTIKLKALCAVISNKQHLSQHKKASQPCSTSSTSVFIKSIALLSGYDNTPDSSLSIHECCFLPRSFFVPCSSSFNTLSRVHQDTC